jgi:hypothetical protein
MPEIDQAKDGTKPEEFHRDMTELLRCFDAMRSLPADFKWAPHPKFGPLTAQEWGKLGYKHLDHHLRQFGV